jgi:methionine-rich copper-binding protein CopC
MPLLRRRVAVLATLGVIVLQLGRPSPTAAHAALVSSDPANRATVPAGFAGPIVLTYSEGLRAGSHAELLSAGGAKSADATIDAANPTRMVFTLASPLEAGPWSIQWTSVAADRDVERGQLSFTVAAATPSPTAPPTQPPTALPTVAPTTTPAPTASPAVPSPAASPSPTPASPSAGDVVVPIAAALALVAIAALFLVRRRGGTG